MPEKDKAKETPDAAAAAAAAAPAPKKGKGWILLTAFPVLGAVGAVVLTIAVPHPAAAPAHHDSESKKEILEYFTISEVKSNLARSGGMHFCLLDLQIQFRTREDRLEGILKRLGAFGRGEGGADSVPSLGGAVGTLARDRLILLLASKGMDDLEGRDKKDQLKSEIQRELDPLLFPDKDAEIVAVFFKDLLIQ